MDITTLLIATFCLIDDFLAGRRMRKRGPQPTLRDSEILASYKSAKHQKQF